MLKSIKIKNFCSIGEMQEISFEITAKDVLNDSARQIDDGSYMNLVSCIVGHNASGKTTVLKAISFLFYFIQSSYTEAKAEQKIPIEPHKLKENEPTFIEIEFFNETDLYKYSIELNEKEVLKESLEKKSNRMIPIFKLVREENNTEIETSLKLNKTDEERFKKRKNVSLLSSLINTGYLSDISFFKMFDTNVNQRGLLSHSSIRKCYTTSTALFADENLRKEVLDFTKNIDLGISDFSFFDVPKGDLAIEKDGRQQILQCIHKLKGNDFKLYLFEESNGTQHSFSILTDILPILKTGGLVVLDEIESGLHPDVVRKIIFLFESKKTNPNNAQLIFSTHQHPLLNDRTKTQIFLTEKSDSTFETEIFRLDDIEGVRNDENYFHKYIAGAYGGKANINWI
ncbi:MAG: AAA family ATPase [Candidatus Pacebacteria bacterium]|nr:AAA family ATPase [Candidatus Paceibacterota bacterium]